MEINRVFNMNCVILDSEARPVIQACSRLKSTFWFADCLCTMESQSQHGRQNGRSFVSSRAWSRRLSGPPAVCQKDDMFSCEAESSVKLPSLHVCRGFFPSVFRGKAFGSDRQNPHELFKTGTRRSTISWSLALRNKSERWLFKEHSCVKFNY